MKTYRITRKGCLAIHLMEYFPDPRQLNAIVDRIASEGPMNAFEEKMVAKANEEKVDYPLLPTKQD